jgi:hypothetical protein
MDPESLCGLGDIERVGEGGTPPADTSGTGGFDIAVARRVRTGLG